LLDLESNLWISFGRNLRVKHEKAHLQVGAYLDFGLNGFLGLSNERFFWKLLKNYLLFWD
jgi:hypothetical protein